jgi:hypothetical protein
MSSLRKFYGRHHKLVNIYWVTVSQMTTDMVSLLLLQNKRTMTYKNITQTIKIEHHEIH